jgi:hypothetical protein
MNKAQYVIGITEEMLSEDGKSMAVKAGVGAAGVYGAGKLLKAAGKKFKDSIEQGHAGAGAQKIKDTYKTAKEIAGK